MLILTRHPSESIQIDNPSAVDPITVTLLGGQGQSDQNCHLCA